MIYCYLKTQYAGLGGLLLLFLMQFPVHGISQNTRLIVTPGTNFIASSGNLILQNSDILNNGNFDASKSTVAFTGSSSSAISGNDSVLINVFTLNKYGGSAAVILNTDVHVSGRVDFGNGLINLNGSTFLLSDTAFLNNESDTSRITGTTGGWVVANAATVNNSSNLNIANIGAAITSTQNLGGVNISRTHKPAKNPATGLTGIQRTFLIQPTYNSSLNATLRFYYLDAELNGKDENTLSLWTSSDGVTWTVGGVTNRDTANNYVEKAGLDSLSYFTLSDANDALPITLLYFRALCKDDYTLIEWKTGTESGTLNFDIQKSLDGINWVTIQTISAENNINGALYDYKDGDPQPVSYYRLKTNDLSGAYTYSPVFSGGCADIAMPLVVYPNPAVNNAVARISVRQPAEAIIQLYNISGQQLYTSQWSLQAGSNQFVLPVQSFTANTYLVRVLIAGNVLQTKFIKQ